VGVSVLMVWVWKWKWDLGLGMEGLVLVHPWISPLIDEDFSGSTPRCDLATRAMASARCAAETAVWWAVTCLQESRGVQTRCDGQFHQGPGPGEDAVGAIDGEHSYGRRTVIVDCFRLWVLDSV